eukprot:Tbor_TRINITY_DN5369_c3_g2::TRINITY_DN5369_c3_g2_i21::g.3963::m.3963
MSEEEQLEEIRRILSLPPKADPFTILGIDIFNTLENNNNNINNIITTPPIPLTGPSRRPYIFKHKHYLLFTCRVHAGECPSNYILHGAIDFYLNINDNRSRFLRRNTVLVIIPCINIDGVVRGYSRADVTGMNLNRVYRSVAGGSNNINININNIDDLNNNNNNNNK